MFKELPEFWDWLAERAASNRYQVKKTSLNHMVGWRVDPETGNVVHQSGKFFSVQGLKVETDHRATSAWSQPIIVQPEIGILGILARVVDGVGYFLMQAKMEPGNINMLQLSPTVQATKSNYTTVHDGNPVTYLEHFVAPRQGRTIFDSLQSEQGSWFLSKRNRNMIVEVNDDIPAKDDFCWLSVEQITELMTAPNLVNMDTRTVLSGIRHFPGVRLDGPAPHDKPAHTMAEILGWFTEVKSRYHLTRSLMPLAELPDWELQSGQLVHRDSKHFTVVGVDVYATNREVGRWSQPMFAPRARGIVAFIGRHINDTFHLLVHARTEAGTQDVVEMAPTISCIPANYADRPADQHPRYLDVIKHVPPSRALVDVIHSEEGGRMFHAENRYLVADVGEDFGIEVPDDYCWMTVGQLSDLIRYSSNVNVAARCLISCLMLSPAPETAGLAGQRGAFA